MRETMTCDDNDWVVRVASLRSNVRFPLELESKGAEKGKVWAGKLLATIIARFTAV